MTFQSVQPCTQHTRTHRHGMCDKCSNRHMRCGLIIVMLMKEVQKCVISGRSPAKIMFLQATNWSCSAAARHVTRTTVSVDNLTVVLTVGMRNFSAGIVVYFPSSYIIRYHLKKHGNFETVSTVNYILLKTISSTNSNFLHHFDASVRIAHKRMDNSWHSFLLQYPYLQHSMQVQDKIYRASFYVSCVVHMG